MDTQRLLAAAESFEWVEGVTPLSTMHEAAGAVALYLASLWVMLRVCGPAVKPAPRRPGERRPLTVLNAVLACHNVLLMLASLLMLGGCVVALLDRIKVMSVYELFCDPERQLTRGATYFWPYVFYLSKYWELLDTAFIIVKRKELLFLHVYHHCATLILAWVGMNNEVSLLFVPLILNTFVHVLMYFQYAATALGYTVGWKPYLTRVQMTQFWINVAVMLAMICIDAFVEPGPRGCAGPTWANWLFIIVQLSFFALFRSFFNKRFPEEGAKERVKEA